MTRGDKDQDFFAIQSINCMPPIIHLSILYDHKTSDTDIFIQKYRFTTKNPEPEKKRVIILVEMSGHSLSLSYAKAANSLSPPIFPAKTTSFGRATLNFHAYNCLPRNLNFSARELRNFVAIRASDSTTEAATNASSTWLLQAVGQLTSSPSFCVCERKREGDLFIDHLKVIKKIVELV